MNGAGAGCSTGHGIGAELDRREIAAPIGVGDEIVEAVRAANPEQLLAGLINNESVLLRRLDRRKHGMRQWVIAMATSKPPARAAAVVDVHGLDAGPSRVGA